MDPCALESRVDFEGITLLDGFKSASVHRVISHAKPAKAYMKSLLNFTRISMECFLNILIGLHACWTFNWKTTEEITVILLCALRHTNRLGES